MMKKLIFSLVALLLISCQNKLNFPLEPIAFWDFSGEGENVYISSDKNHFTLLPGSGTYPEIVETGLGGVLSHSVRFNGDSDWLYIPYEQTGDLNIKTNEVTVIALVKWEEKPNCFVAGMWNEYTDGGKRQYGLFVSLPHYNGNKKVCGHISATGGPTPPFPYSIDYSTSDSDVETDSWHYVAMTYDGSYIKSYYDGKFEEVRDVAIDHTKGFEGYPDGLVQDKNPYYYPNGMGNNGSDFTVGAVQLASGIGNFFKGEIANIAVFNKCLDEKEIIRFIFTTTEDIKGTLQQFDYSDTAIFN